MANVLDSYIADPETGCWQWCGGVTPEGYGMYWREGRNWHVHRAHYERVHGPIPEGLTIDHLCRNPRCCNPAHLEAVTLRENLLRGNGAAARNARKTHCIRGHPLTGDNLYVDPRGKRECRICRRRAQTRYIKEVR